MEPGRGERRRKPSSPSSIIAADTVCTSLDLFLWRYARLFPSPTDIWKSATIRGPGSMGYFIVELMIGSGLRGAAAAKTM